MNSYALNYRARKQTFGNQFKYDGEHDFEYWKLRNGNQNYKDYWTGMRDAFVHDNFTSVNDIEKAKAIRSYESMHDAFVQGKFTSVNDIKKTKVTRNYGDMTTGFYKNNRISQVISAKNSWASLSRMMGGLTDGSLMVFDLETFGNIRKAPNEGFSSIMELGFHYRQFQGGVRMTDLDDTFTLVFGKSKKQLESMESVINSYIGSGYNALNDDEQWLINVLSKYGQVDTPFKKEKIAKLGNKEFTVLTDEAAHAIPNPNNTDYVLNGFEKVKNIWADSNYQKEFNKTMKASIEFINSSLSNPNVIVGGANSMYEATVLARYGLNVEAYTNNVVDVVYGNTAIAADEGVSVYTIQRNATLSSGVTSENVGGVENSSRAAGLNKKEFHSGGLDSFDTADILTNKQFNYYSYSSNVANAANHLKNPDIDFNEKYFYLKTGALDKNKMDHAVLDGDPTQSRSIRGHFYTFDEEHSGYTMFEKRIPDPDNPSRFKTAEPEHVYVMSLIDEDGNRVSKQFETQQESKSWLMYNSSIMPKDTKLENVDEVKEMHKEITLRDNARRTFDEFFNPRDISRTDKFDKGTKTYEEINGYDELKKYLNVVEDIDKQLQDGKEFNDIVTPDYLKKSGIHGNYKQDSFKYVYTKIKSEETLLRDAIGYIDDSFKDGNNLQKTVALKNIRESYIKNVVEKNGYTRGYIDVSKNKTHILDALGIDILVDDEYKRLRGDSVESILKDLKRAFKDADKSVMQVSMFDLGRRNVLPYEEAMRLMDLIGNTTSPHTDYGKTILSDIAESLSKVTEPILDDPIYYINNYNKIGLSEEQQLALKSKLVNPSTYDSVMKDEQTIFRPAQSKRRSKYKTLSELAEGKTKKGFKFDSNIKAIKANDIIANARQISFANKNTAEIITNISEKLGYNDNEKNILMQMFYGGSTEKSEEYAIFKRKGAVQSFIVDTTEKSNSAFILLTNEEHSSKIADMLSSNAIENFMTDNNINRITKYEMKEMFGNDAVIVELKKFNRTDILDFTDIYGEEAKYLAPFFNDSTMAQMTTVNQGEKIERFMFPRLNVYEDSNGIIHGQIRSAGEDFLGAYRLNGKDILDSVEDGNFELGNRKISKNQDKILTDFPSPSGYIGYKRNRTVNYNYNDVLHGTYFDARGLKDTFKYQLHNIIKRSDVDNPLYQIVQSIGVSSGTLKEVNNPLSISVSDSIIDSSSFHEFFAKNILLGKVSEDGVIAEKMSLFSNIKKEAFNKNILGMMIDEANMTKGFYSEEFIDTLNTIQKASPFMNQILNETNTNRLIFSFIRPDNLVDLGMINNTLRPTYGQVLNALRFDIEDIKKSTLKELEKGDVIVGPVSRTNTEQLLLDTFGNVMKAPSGKLYAEEERIVMTPFKQMSDADLTLRYKELDNDILNYAVNGTDEEKLLYAYDIFKKEHMSIHEGKWFGAPILFNEEPFTSTDIKKVSIPSLKDNKEYIKQVFDNWVGDDKKISYGDVLFKDDNGYSILWEGPTTHLTKDNISEFYNAGESYIEPSNRMISDIKAMVQQEKATVHFALIDDVFMQKHRHMFGNKEEALRYMQTVFDAVTGYDPSMGYRPMLIGNISSYKHGNALSIDNAFRVILHEYEKSDDLKTLIDKLRTIDEFKDWKLSSKEIYNREILLSNQLNKKGTEEGIQKLYDMIMNGTSDIDKRIQETFNYLIDNDINYAEMQRVHNNEIMGSRVYMDERMKQSTRLRAYERDFDSIDYDNKYLKQLVKDVDSGYYSKGSMVDSYEHKKYYTDYAHIHAEFDKMANETINVQRMRRYNSDIRLQGHSLIGINKSLLNYAGELNVDESEILRVDIDEILKRLPEENITLDDVRDLIFYNDKKASNLLKELTKVNKSASGDAIYLDFGTLIKNPYTKKEISGIVVPIFDVHIDPKTNKPFFTDSQSALTAFLNSYKKNIGTQGGTDKISESLVKLFNAFSKEMIPYDIKSLSAKTVGRILLPHSAQSLAQEEVAPIVEAMFDDDYLKKIMGDKYTLSLKELMAKESAIRKAAAKGDFSKLDELDDIVAQRFEITSAIAKEIQNGSQHESLFKLSQLESVGESYKGIEVIKNKKYFANAFEMNLENLEKRYGVNVGLIGYQVYTDTLYEGNGKVVSFETNKKFDNFIKNKDAIEERIRANLKNQGINVDGSGKDLIRQINTLIAEDYDSGIDRGIAKKLKNATKFIGIKYLEDVGIIAREVWRPPVFSAQIPGRIYLNQNVGNNQLRVLTGGSTSIIDNVDFDGDMFMASFSLNGNGGLRTMDEDYFLRQSYFESVKANNSIIANLIKDGEAFKKDSLNDIKYFRLEQLKKFNEEEYTKGLNEWIYNNKINVTSISDLTDSQLIRASRSKELGDAFARFSFANSVATNENIIRAAIAARIRKDNIGSISTPNFKLRSTIETLKNGVTATGTILSEEERRIAFDIMQDITSIDSSKLLDLVEQKSIDVKHIFDAVTLAETPKWAKGVSLLFNGKEKEKGLKLMLTAVNNSTFMYTEKNGLSVEKQLSDISKKIIATDRNVLRKEIAKNEKELLNYSVKSSEYKALSKTLNEQKLVLQFKAIYDATNIKAAGEVQKYVLKNKSAIPKDVIETLVKVNKLIEQGLFKGMSVEGAEGDLINVISRTLNQARFKGDETSYYILPGSLEKNMNPKNRIFQIGKITKSNVIFNEMEFDEYGKLVPTNKTWKLSKKDTNHVQLNKALDNYIEANKYQYINDIEFREKIDLEVDRRKIANTLTGMVNEKNGNLYNKYTSFEIVDEYGNINKSVGKFGLGPYKYISGISVNSKTLERTRELLKDYEFYIASNNLLDKAPAPHALIKDINKAIAEKYEPGKMFTAEYDELVKKYITSSIEGVDISDLGLQIAHDNRISVGDFSIEKYTEQINQLNNNIFDTVKSEAKLKESFNNLQSFGKDAEKSGLKLSKAYKNTVKNRDSIINNTINNIRSINNKTIESVQNNIYNLFNDTNQMDAFFKWRDGASDKSIVGFGEYLGAKFDDLSNDNIKSILSTAKNIKNNTKLMNTMSDKEIHALETTYKLLNDYTSRHKIQNTLGITHDNIHESVEAVLQNNDKFKLDFATEDINKIFNDMFKNGTVNSGTGKASEGLKRKTLKDAFGDVKMPSMKTVGVAVGVMAALGVANKLLHKDKNKSPVSPEFSNDHNNPGFQNGAMNQDTQPPIAPSSKKVIYADKSSNLNFKVSAKTNNYINDMNNAKLVGMANRGSANIYSQQDKSGVTDNWLENKFAELT